MLLYRIGPEGLYAVVDGEETPRVLYSDPMEVRPGGWEFGREVSLVSLLPPVRPGKIVGVGRNYREHAAELGNPMPEEPLLFLKAPSSVIGPNAPIVLPPQSEQVEFEGEIAVVLRRPLTRASRDEARSAVLGITCGCDVTARDLQRRDATFARAKSFDTFCPLGPAIAVEPVWEETEVITRVNGEERQRGSVDQMSWDPFDLISYVSHSMTLDAGDVILTGTPAGVGILSAGDALETEVTGVGVLNNRVEAYQGAV